MHIYYGDRRVGHTPRIMALWTERHLDVRGTAVPVVPHAWERACRDIMEALDGEGTVVRGRIRYERDHPSLSRYPHTPKIDGDGEVLFSDVWNSQEYWLTWVVGHDGTAYEPIAAWPEFEPSLARNRKLMPFDDVIQTVLAKKVLTSWNYVANLLCRLDCDAPAARELDSTEVKAFGDIFMLPVLDRIGIAPISAAPKAGAGVGGGLVAVRNIKKGDVVAAMPVDAVVHHSTLIREYALPLSTARRFRYPLSPSDAAALREAEHAVETESLASLMNGATIVGDGNSICISRRAPKPGTFYNLHAAASADTGYNACKIIVRHGDRTISVIAFADKDIEAGQDILLRTDPVAQKARDLALKHREAVDRAPRQQVYAFTDVGKVVELKLL